MELTSELKFRLFDNFIYPGALAFLRSISLEAIGLGVHLAGGAHELLLQTENILASVQPVAPSSRDNGTASVRCNQPKNSQHGIQQVVLIHKIILPPLFFCI